MMEEIKMTIIQQKGIRKTVVAVLFMFLSLSILTISGCGSGGTPSVTTSTTGTVTGYVYVPVGNARIAAMRTAAAAPAGYKPLANATVTVVGSTLSDTTDGTGKYEIASVPAGAKQLTISASGYATTTIDVTVTAGATTTVGGDSGSQIYTAQKGTIRVTWTPVDLAVDSVTIDGETTGFTTTPATLENVSAATHTIVITKTGYTVTPTSQAPLVSDSATAEISFTLTSNAPTITNFTPTSGAVGASVTITGTNFGATQGTSSVKFNNVSATCGSWSATSLTCAVPTGATTGTISVTTSEGTATSSSSFSVTVVSKVVFNTKPATGNRRIVTINSDGTGRTDLTDGTYDDFAPAWSPDSAKIAFCSLRSGDVDKSLYIMNADGSSVTKIKEITGERCDEVDWSPDGTMLAYATAIGPLSPTYKAYKINVDGTGLVNLGEGYYLVWNADGSKIFMTAPADSYKLTSINPDGTGAAALTLFGYSPHEISPDGTMMLFGGDVPATEIVGGGTGTVSGLFHGNANGSGSYTLIFENVTSPQELYCDLGCSWSQDGTKIVYDKYLSGTGMGIYIANLDGSGTTLLSTEAVAPDWNK